jgi:hypothetical protein
MVVLENLNNLLKNSWPQYSSNGKQDFFVAQKNVLLESIKLEKVNKPEMFNNQTGLY